MVKLLLAATLMAHPGELGYADYLYGQGEYYRASGEYHRYLYAHPEAPEALWGLGRAYRRGGRLEEAVRVLARVPASHPLGPYARFTLGQAYATLGRRPEAEAAFAAMPEPLIALARLQLGRLSAEAGDWALARGRFLAAGRPELAALAGRRLAGRPYSPWVAGALSVVPGAGHLYLGRPDDALSAFTMPVGLALVSGYYLQRDQQALGLALGGLSAVFWGGGVYGAAREAARANQAAVEADMRAIRQAAEAADPRPE